MRRLITSGLKVESSPKLVPHSTVVACAVLLAGTYGHGLSFVSDERGAALGEKQIQIAGVSGGFGRIPLVALSLSTDLLMGVVIAAQGFQAAELSGEGSGAEEGGVLLIVCAESTLREGDVFARYESTKRLHGRQ